MITDWMQDILSASWLQTLIEMLLWVFISLASIVLLPFSLVIQQFFPGFDEALQSVADLFDLAGTYIGYVIDAMGIPAIVINMIVGYYSFVILATLYVWAAKIVVKWVDVLR